MYFLYYFSPTFVMKNAKTEPIQDNCEITISACVRHVTRIYGNIKIEPENANDSIDYYELYIDDILQKTIISSKDVHFSADLIPPHDNSNFETHLPPGKHQCYLKGIPKDKHQEPYKSNVVVCR